MCFEMSNALVVLSFFGVIAGWGSVVLSAFWVANVTIPEWKARQAVQQARQARQAYKH